MFSKLTGLFKNKANLEEIAYLEAHKIQWDAEQGYIVDGIVLNNVLAARLVVKYKFIKIVLPAPAFVSSLRVIWYNSISNPLFKIYITIHVFYISDIFNIVQ